MIVISKTGITLEYFNNQGRHVSDAKDILYRCLDHTVYVEDDVTVGDIFAHLKDQSEMINTMFDYSLNGYDFEEFIKDLDAPNEPDGMLEYAVFSHECTVEDGVLYHSIRFGAMGQPVEFLFDGAVRESIPHSLEFSPLSTYKHLVVRLNRAFIVTATERVNGEDIEAILFSADKEFSLQEFIHSLLYEISYHGNPSMRDELFNELKSKTLQYMESNNQMGDNPYFILANIDRKIKELEVELDVALSQEEYETSAELRDKINELKREKAKFSEDEAK